MPYTFHAEWCKGKLNDAPNALFCKPDCQQQQLDTQAEWWKEGSQQEPSIAELRVTKNEGSESPHLQKVQEQAEDERYQQRKSLIVNDHTIHLPVECRCYWSVREHLLVDDNLVVYGS